MSGSGMAAPGSQFNTTVSTPAPKPPGTPKSPPPDDLTLTVNGQIITGWEDIRVTRSCERVPADFDVQLTDYNPASNLFDTLREGLPVQVKLGGDLVLTGYIDTYQASLGPNRHSVRVAGRSASLDMVDSSAQVNIDPAHQWGNTIAGGSFLSMAQFLAAPYGITIKSPSSRTGFVFPQFNFIVTETPYEIIERVARFLQVLVYDDTDGSLLLADVAQTKMATGIAQGVNVEEASVNFSMAERYQKYIPALAPVDPYAQISNLSGTSGNQPFPTVTDPGVPTTGLGGQPRLRQLFVVSGEAQPDAGGNIQLIAEQRAQWEAARRRGRSQVLRCVVDSWRDQAGTLWTPNAVIDVNLPALHLQPQVPWVIGSVSFRRSADSGTTAELEVMAQEAFSIEPIPLVTYDAQLVLAGQNPAAAPSTTPATNTGPTVRLLPIENGPSQP
jgi:prophage tail gpP-like protein